MKKSLPLTKLLLATVAGISLASLVVPQAGLADTANPVQDLNQQNSTSSDPFSSTNNGNSFGVLDLIHRVNLSNQTNAEEFNAQQNQNLNDAAAAFRARQVQLLNKNQRPNLQPTAASQPIITLPVSK